MHQRRHVLALVALACLASATTAAAQTPTDVTVTAWLYGQGGSKVPDSTTVANLESGSCPLNDPASDPTQYGPGGSTGLSDTPTSEQWALATILQQCLPVAVQISQVTNVVMLRDGIPESSDGMLGPGDLELPSDFADTASWPIVWDSGGVVQYERPSRDANDVNSADQIEVNSGGTLEFEVFEGVTPQSLAVSASPSAAAVGAPVSFSVELPGSPAGESYDWNFDGAASDSTAASPTVSFPVAGLYHVSVQVTGQIDGYGSVQLQVGSPTVETGTVTTSTGPSTTAGVTLGGSPGKRRHGAPVRHKPKRRFRKRRHRAARRPPVRTTVAATPAPSPPSSSSGSGSTSPSASGVRVVKLRTRHPGTAHRAIVAKRPATSTAAPKAKPELARIRGRILGVVEPLPAGQTTAPTVTTAAGTAPPLRRPAGAVPVALIASLGAVLLLLALGAGRELRPVRSAP